jgi:hypothetical protein
MVFRFEKFLHRTVDDAPIRESDGALTSSYRRPDSVQIGLSECHFSRMIPKNVRRV